MSTPWKCRCTFVNAQGIGQFWVFMYLYKLQVVSMMARFWGMFMNNLVFLRLMLEISPTKDRCCVNKLRVDSFIKTMKKPGLGCYSCIFLNLVVEILIRWWLVGGILQGNCDREGSCNMLHLGYQALCWFTINHTPWVSLNRDLAYLADLILKGRWRYKYQWLCHCLG